MTLYRFLMTILLGLMLVRQATVRLTRRTQPDLSDRTATTTALPEGDGPLLWVHGASNGELTAARPLLTALLDDRPVRLLVTTNSLSARAMVAGWGLARTTVRLAPLDHPWIVGPFLDRAAPAALVILENELWPERILRAEAAGIPVLLIGGRLSAGSARNWARLPGLARRLMAAISWLSPQDALSRDRFLALGLQPDRLGPILQLKALADGRATLVGTGLPFARADTILAASTHEGEDEIVLDAFATLRRTRPEARLILAPRHPRRRDQIEALLLAADLRFATRSRGQEAEAGTAVYLADTLGEMARWYQAAGVTFVGGSLVERGGHTPFEPAAFDCAILHGPFLDNFAAPYAALDAQGGAVAVAGVPALVAALTALAGQPGAQAALAAQARQALAPFTASDPQAAFLSALDRLLPAATRDPRSPAT